MMVHTGGQAVGLYRTRALEYYMSQYCWYEAPHFVSPPFSFPKPGSLVQILVDRRAFPIFLFFFSTQVFLNIFIRNFTPILGFLVGRTVQVMQLEELEV